MPSLACTRDAMHIDRASCDKPWNVVFCRKEIKTRARNGAVMDLGWVLLSCLSKLCIELDKTCGWFYSKENKEFTDAGAGGNYYIYTQYTYWEPKWTDKTLIAICGWQADGQMSMVMAGQGIICSCFYLQHWKCECGWAWVRVWYSQCKCEVSMNRSLVLTVCVTWAWVRVRYSQCECEVSMSKS